MSEPAICAGLRSFRDKLNTFAERQGNLQTDLQETASEQRTAAENLLAKADVLEAKAEQAGQDKQEMEAEVVRIESLMQEAGCNY